MDSFEAEVLDDGKKKLLNDTFMSGYIPIGTNGEELFYLMFESRSDPNRDPLLIWLNGGPGCSSMLGAFTENGPYWLKYNPDDHPRVRLENNVHSWNQQANVLYLDQPIGVGYSYNDGDVTRMRYSER